MTTTARDSKAYFKITGEFVTRFARDRVIEGNWQEAIEFLTDSLPGFGYDNAVDVLRCRKKLVGINNLAIEEDTPSSAKEYIATLAFQFAGLWRDSHEKYYFEPYAVVTNVGGQDLVGPSVSNPWVNENETRTKATNWLWRALCYADDRRKDRPVFMRVGKFGEKPVLWRIVATPPFWLPIATDPQTALLRFLATHRGRLDERGYSQGRVSCDEPVCDEKAEESDRPNTSIIEDLLVNATPQLRGTWKAIAGEFDEESEPTTTTLNFEFAWLSPDGGFYGCEFHEHSSLARRILRHVIGMPGSNVDALEGEDPGRKLEESGWLKLGIGLDGTFRATATQTITNEQRRMLFCWAKKQGLKPRDVMEQL